MLIQLILAFVLVSLFWWFYLYFQYRSLYSLPCVKSRGFFPILGHAIPILRGGGDFLHLLEDYGKLALQKSHQPVVVWFGPWPIVLLTDPKQICEVFKRPDSGNLIKSTFLEWWKRKGILGKGLIAAEGHFWKINRGAVINCLDDKNVSKVFKTFGKKRCETLIKKWVSQENNIDIHHDILDVNLNVVIDVFFNTEKEELRNELVRQAKDLFSTAQTCSRFTCLPLINNFNQLSQFRRKFDKTLLDIVVRRLPRWKENKDTLLDGLDYLAKELILQGRKEEQIRDEVKTIIGGAHETSTQLMSWTLFYLSNNQAWIDLVRQEGEKEQYDFLKKLINEILRIFPPSFVIVRKILKSIDIEDKLHLPSGAYVGISQYISGRDPKLHDNPLDISFVRDIQRGTIFPFGLDDKKCPGQTIAQQQAILVISEILNACEIQLAGPFPSIIAGGNLLAGSCLLNVKKRT